MGLTITVGTPEDVFIEDYALIVRNTLMELCGFTISKPGQEVWCSGELGWSWWVKLQELASRKLPRKAIPNLLSMEAWNGVFLPEWTEIGSIEFDNQDTPLDVASLDGFVLELETLGAMMAYPTDTKAIGELLEKYNKDDELADADPEIQMYASLLLAAREALQRSLPLWIIK